MLCNWAPQRSECDCVSFADAASSAGTVARLPPFAIEIRGKAVVSCSRPNDRNRSEASSVPDLISQLADAVAALEAIDVPAASRARYLSLTRWPRHRERDREHMDEISVSLSANFLGRPVQGVAGRPGACLCGRPGCEAGPDLVRCPIRVRLTPRAAKPVERNGITAAVPVVDPSTRQHTEIAAATSPSGFHCITAMRLRLEPTGHSAFHGAAAAVCCWRSRTARRAIDQRCVSVAPS